MWSQWGCPLLWAVWVLFAQMAVNQVIWKVVGCNKDTGIHHGIIARKKTKLFMSTHADIYL